MLQLCARPPTPQYQGKHALEHRIRLPPLKDAMVGMEQQSHSAGPNAWKTRKPPIAQSKRALPQHFISLLVGVICGIRAQAIYPKQMLQLCARPPTPQYQGKHALEHRIRLPPLKDA